MSLLLNYDQLFAFAKRKREQYEQPLKEFVAVPTVSSEPNRQPDIERGIDLAIETIRSFGGKAKVHRSHLAIRGQLRECSLWSKLLRDDYERIKLRSS
jgi:hypothetical protein